MRRLALVLGVCLALGRTTSNARETSATPTTTSPTYSTTGWTEVPNPWCTVRLRLYDPVAVTRLVIRMSEFYHPECQSPVPGVSLSYSNGEVTISGFPPGFRGPATILACGQEFHHSLPAPTLDLQVAVLEAQGEFSELPAVCPARLSCNAGGDPQLAPICGDADRNGAIRVMDALGVLRSAVSIETCPLTVCDADRDADVSATDAIMVLRVAVGLNVALICPAPC